MARAGGHLQSRAPTAPALNPLVGCELRRLLGLELPRAAHVVLTEAVRRPAALLPTAGQRLLVVGVLDQPG